MSHKIKLNVTIMLDVFYSHDYNHNIFTFTHKIKLNIIIMLYIFHFHVIKIISLIIIQIITISISV